MIVHNKRGYPPGTADQERCEMRTIEPKKQLLQKNEFVQQEYIFILHDHKNRNFHLLKEKHVEETSEQTNENKVDIAENMARQHENPEEQINVEHLVNPSGFINSIHSSLFPGEEFVDQSNVLETDLETTTIQPTELATLPQGRKRIRISDCLSPVASSSLESSSSLRRSQRLSEKAKKAERIELERILERPSASTEKKEREEAAKIAAFERKRKRDIEEHETAMKALEKNRICLEKKRKGRRQEVGRIKSMAEDLRKNLSAEIIKDIFHDNIEYFKNVEQGFEKSWRYDAFKKGGGQNDKNLQFSMIGSPFSDDQQDLVYEEVKAIWLKDKKMDRFYQNLSKFLWIVKIRCRRKFKD